MANTNQPANVTITSTIGPGESVTATVFNNVTELTYNFAKNVIRIVHAGGLTISYYSYAVVATITMTVSNGQTTVSIS